MRVEFPRAFMVSTVLFRLSGCGVTPSVETVNHTADINEFLLPGKEGMALRADINIHIAFGGVGLDDRTARTFNCCFFIFGMDAGLHFSYLFAVILLNDYSISKNKMQHFFR